MRTGATTALIAVGVGMLAAIATAGMVLSQTPAERVVRITAKRYAYDPPQVTLVRGEPVVLELVSLDRSHGFSMPSLGVREVIPEGGVARVRFVPERVGRFNFLCDVFCGSGHDEMEGEIVVTEP